MLKTLRNLFLMILIIYCKQYCFFTKQSPEKLVLNILFFNIETHKEFGELKKLKKERIHVTFYFFCLPIFLQWK